LEETHRQGLGIIGSRWTRDKHQLCDAPQDGVGQGTGNRLHRAWASLVQAVEIFATMNVPHQINARWNKLAAGNVIPSFVLPEPTQGLKG
jgi:hypothetical protein